MDSNNHPGNLGICVVGLGWGHRHHVRNYSEMDDVDVYVCDLDPEKIALAQAEFDVVGAFASVEEVLASDKVDAVDLALPHHLHRPVAVRAAEAGKHCMVEKPIALNLREADQMLEAADRAGTRLAVAENYQFMADSTEARRVIDSGLVGRVFMVRVQELTRMEPRPGSWWFQRETAGGGALMSMGTHSVRTLRLLAGGDAELVFAAFSEAVSPDIGLEGEDTSTLTVKFDNGVVGNVITSWATLRARRDSRFEVYGTDGTILDHGGFGSPYPRVADTLVVHSNRLPGLEPDMGELRVDLKDHPHQEGFAAECREFVDWIRSERDSPINAAQGRKDLEVVKAGYRSAATGQAVQIRQ